MSERDAMTEDRAQDQLRAGTWGLLGRLLAAPPDAAVLDNLRRIASPSADAADAMAGAWVRLRDAAVHIDPVRAAREYQDVFIGVGHGEVIPYASYYLRGALMERPLVQLRHDLQALGVERREDVAEPEDHAAAVCETMALISADPDIAFDWQPTFFERHIANWMERFFTDLQQAPSADFYRAVAAVGQAFIALEQRYFSMPA